MRWCSVDSVFESLEFETEASRREGVAADFREQRHEISCLVDSVPGWQVSSFRLGRLEFPFPGRCPARG